MTTKFNVSKAFTAMVLLATLGAGLASTQAMAEGYGVQDTAITDNFPQWDRLNIRAWPASHSRKIAQVKLDRVVFVERCIIKSGNDWCKISKGWKRGWVNGRFLRTGHYTYAQVHPWYGY